MRKRIALLMLAAAVTGCTRTPAAPPSPVPAAAPPTQNAPKEAPNRADWRPIPLPEGYTAVAAMGDALVLKQLGHIPMHTLRLYKDGQLQQSIATRPFNHMFEFAADERWMVWIESKEDVGSSQVDQWSIWAWDRTTEQAHKVAEANATAREMGLPGNWDIGPRIRVSAGRLLWGSFDKTEEGTRIRLHLVELASGQERIVATGPPDQHSLLAYDLRADRIAYRWIDQIVLQTGTEEVRWDAHSTGGEVLLTLDAVVWAAGLDSLYMRVGAESRKLPIPTEKLWEFTSTDHYVAWIATNATEVHLLHTPSGREVTFDQAIQGAEVMGQYVAWHRPRVGEGTGPGPGMVAKLLP